MVVRTLIATERRGLKDDNRTHGPVRTVHPRTTTRFRSIEFTRLGGPLTPRLVSVRSAVQQYRAGSVDPSDCSTPARRIRQAATPRGARLSGVLVFCDSPFWTPGRCHHLDLSNGVQLLCTPFHYLAFAAGYGSRDQEERYPYDCFRFGARRHTAITAAARSESPVLCRGMRRDGLLDVVLYPVFRRAGIVAARMGMAYQSLTRRFAQQELLFHLPAQSSTGRKSTRSAMFLRTAGS